MRAKHRSLVLGAVMGLLLIGLLGRVAAAFDGDFCCVCTRCNGGFLCTNEVAPTDCLSFCENKPNGTSCGSELIDGPCSAVPQCDARGTTRAPALSTAGLTAVTLLLLSFGVLGLRGAARRKQR
jgi:hypothetical protein